jgi:ferredoxin
MTHVVTEKCIKCKYTTCVEVCPVNCFYEGELMLAIDPDACIDCGVCVQECLIDAISEEKEHLIDWIEKARYFTSKWPLITKQKEPYHDADKYIDEKDKYAKYMQ